MFKFACTCAKLLTIAWVICATHLAAAADNPLATLRPQHPRLMVLDDQIHDVQRLIQTDTTARDTLERLKKSADKMIDQPPVQHVLIGPRLLDKSRKALQVISTTAGLYRLTGDVKYADRARKEMLTVCGFADWNPSHFLDVAEMTNACGIGYDWIYERLSEDDRKTIRQAIVDKAFKPAISAYTKSKPEFWTDCNMNWGQVCAAGLTVGALAIGDEEPDISWRIMALTRKTITQPMAQFAPDGGWEEGPGYWNYATSYNVYYLAAVESALGTDFGLDATPGFSNTGMFHIQLMGPTNKFFNFADANSGLEAAPQMFWLAKKFNHPEFAAWERAVNLNRLNIFHLLWFNPDGEWPPKEAMPLDAEFKRIDVGFFRSSWTDPNAWYIGFKGGDNAVNHSHLDLGSFVLDAFGQRWAVDLGPDDYNLPGYFGKQRFTYYRLSTAAHNTITFHKQNQTGKAKAPVTAFNSQPDLANAVIDLSAGYPMANSVRRGISLLDRSRVLLQDEIDMDQPGPVEWNFHTPAKVAVAGQEAVLSLGGSQMRVTLLSPANGRFETETCEAPTPQKANPGITNLVVNCRGSTKITVLFRAMDDKVVPGVKELAK